MAVKKKFLLRISEDLYVALEKWAADDLRSVNAQMEYLLAEAAKRAGRLKAGTGQSGNPGTADEGGEEEPGK